MGARRNCKVTRAKRAQQAVQAARLPIPGTHRARRLAEKALRESGRRQEYTGAVAVSEVDDAGHREHHLTRGHAECRGTSCSWRPRP